MVGRWTTEAAKLFWYTLVVHLSCFEILGRNETSVTRNTTARLADRMQISERLRTRGSGCARGTRVLRSRRISLAFIFFIVGSFHKANVIGECAEWGSLVHDRQRLRDLIIDDGGKQMYFYVASSQACMKETKRYTSGWQTWILRMIVCASIVDVALLYCAFVAKRSVCDRKW